MSRALICDRCGAAIIKYSQMNEINITPYVGIRAVAETLSKSFDLCKDCTETLMQYINNEVDMVIFSNKEAADDQTEHSDPGI